MYERHVDPLLPIQNFRRRVVRHGAVGGTIVLGSLCVGMLGYRVFEHMSWVDALLNASMLLSGMGPASQLATWQGKVFASLYALYSGLALIAVTAIMIAPFAHRLIHHLHSLPPEDRRKSSST